MSSFDELVKAKRLAAEQRAAEERQKLRTAQAVFSGWLQNVKKSEELVKLGASYRSEADQPTSMHVGEKMITFHVAPGLIQVNGKEVAVSSNSERALNLVYGELDKILYDKICVYEQNVNNQ